MQAPAGVSFLRAIGLIVIHGKTETVGRRPRGEWVQAVNGAARRGPLPIEATRLCIDSPAERDLRGRGVPVAVIDSGVNPDHPHVGAVAGGVRIQLSGDVSGDYVDRMGHGTAVFAAIQEKAPGAELFAVRVFSDRLKTSVRALVAAIDWAAERRVRVVNLSLGTLREEHAAMLEAAVVRLADAGGVVVAAADADGQRWWPGSLPRAVGVVMDADCPRGCVVVRRGDGAGPEVVAGAPYPRPIPGVPVERNLSGISFAVANVTGMLARVLEGVDGPVTRERCLVVLKPEG